MKALKGALNISPIDFKTRHAIKEKFWPPTTLPTYQQDSLDWEPYFRYYDRQCQAALVDRGRFVMAKTHQDILDLIHGFDNGLPRESIKESLKLKLSTRGRSNEDEILDGAIDLAARLYLMVNVAVDTRMISVQTRLQWATGDLKQCLQAHFGEPHVLSDSGLRLEPTFTAANFEYIAGIRVVPTDNLADHLRLMDRDDTVAVFCNVSFLRRNCSTVLPDGLAAETLQTLSLLFPLGDVQTRRWLEKHATSQGLDTALSFCNPLKLTDRQFEEFAFWHDRLVILKQAFNQSRPPTISQWWYDRRNGVQWYTFWVAIVVLILTIFFGLVQSIEGALQVYKAFHST
ncbi:hypothetical protein BU25DRAFT_432621 [Macroventuria anomochaeta]|uniref:Uncharacterized protein n=1 Tax=Macroventuria anomochaeta TaxID=301207 RepID=A0ACB6RWL4_9PLEO|nr:uncharacterized protein BU25DRAFT_432621 [Macroventuria anomochaeta]KAF2625647.1 hypothetical protein BU25DRAFT_432621 [Macroventuria anomochaeta]